LSNEGELEFVEREKTMSEKISYETSRGGTCLTPCPHGKYDMDGPWLVGSFACTDLCGCCKESNGKEQYIICDCLGFGKEEEGDEELEMSVSINISDIVSDISKCHMDTAFKVIKELDERMEDWGFTERCFGHFRELMVKKEEEDMEEMAVKEVEGVTVHIDHCCKDHGCKYGYGDCPVVRGVVEQAFPCEDCGDHYES